MKKLIFPLIFMISFLLFSPQSSYANEETKAIPNVEDSYVFINQNETYSVPIYEQQDSSLRSLSFKPKIIANANFRVNSKNIIKYEIVMKPGYKFISFNGYVRVMDITSGLSKGTTYISGPSGSVSVGRHSGHVYRASIGGVVLSSGGYGMDISNQKGLMWKAA